jgi:hypothetical protein
MKTTFPIILFASLLAAVLGGCTARETAGPGTAPAAENPPTHITERDNFVAALDGIGLEKAPTLGPAYRGFLLAAHDKNVDTAWNLVNQPGKDALTKELPEKIAQLEAVTKRMEAELQNPSLSSGARDYYTRSCAENNELIPLLKSFNGDGKKYFAFAMEKTIRLFAEIPPQMEITGETINGDSGAITLKYKDTGTVGQIPFTRENGAWKFDLMGTALP